MSDPMPIVAREQVAAAWATVTATWASAVISALVIGSAFVTLALQRYLDRRRAERRRQYNNLSVLVESMFALNHIAFCHEYLLDAAANDRSVSKYPIRFHLESYARNLEISSATDAVGPGASSAASQAIVIAREVVAHAFALCPGDRFSPDGMAALAGFIALIDPDLASARENLAHQYRNVTSSAEGRWARAEFCRRSRTREGGASILDQLRTGGVPGAA